MIFSRHSDLVGKHAFLSPSKYHWVNYDEDKLDKAYIAAMAARRGDELHAFAHDAIRLGQKLPRNGKTLNMYVNDGIGYRMNTEQPLYYSDNAYGSADCISFRKDKLRIHDLKTGITPASEKQLEVYAALFCLEYRFKPHDIEIELRIYQNDQVNIFDVDDPHSIVVIMDKIKIFDKIINEPLGGAHRDPKEMAKMLKRALADSLRQFQGVKTKDLLAARHEKLMSYGKFKETTASE